MAQRISVLIRQLACADELKMGTIWIGHGCNRALRMGAISSWHSVDDTCLVWLVPNPFSRCFANPCLQRM